MDRIQLEYSSPTVGQRNYQIFFHALRQSHIFVPGIKNDLNYIVIDCDGQYSYTRKFVKYSYTRREVVTLTHCAPYSH